MQATAFAGVSVPTVKRAGANVGIRVSVALAKPIVADVEEAGPEFISEDEMSVTLVMRSAG